jgi:hypothetical protein
LIAHPIAGWDHDLVHQGIGAPPQVHIVVLVIVGWPGSVDTMDEKSRERESRPRERKPHVEIAFDDRWGRPVDL